MRVANGFLRASSGTPGPTGSPKSSLSVLLDVGCPEFVQDNRGFNMFEHGVGATLITTTLLRRMLHVSLGFCLFVVGPPCSGFPFAGRNTHALLGCPTCHR